MIVVTGATGELGSAVVENLLRHIPPSQTVASVRKPDEAGRLKVDVSPIGGEEVLHAIEGIAGAPPDLLDYIKKLLSESKNG